MTEILICSESFVKAVTNISDNLAGKYLRPALREAQEIGLRGIVGDCLLARLKGLVEDGSIRPDAEPKPEFQAYKDLVDRAQYYLAYTVTVELLNKITYKVGNFGVSKTSDENLQVASADEVDRQRWYYQAKADGRCRDLQRWLLANRAAFPELRDCDCAAIQANLKSAASSGLWLGGIRGRIMPGGGGCCGK